MFSSIRSYFLGAAAPAPVEGQAEAEVSGCTETSSSSSLLEQTLNAAASKITEQLLPPSASIEQLQSSSHQLLPTLNEQHEEEELKKLRQRSETSSSLNDATDDDDECFNDDSWELLDLVEKPSTQETNNLKDESSNSTVQDVVCVNMSTLLARHEAAPVEVDNEQPAVVVRSQRQLKVSFKTPDLVTEQELKINQVNSANIVTKPATKKNKNRKNKKKHTPLDTTSPKVEDLCKITGDDSSKVETETVSAIANKKPLLNYAQALKPKIEVNPDSQKEQKASSVCKKTSTLKRIRTVSTTSWSSSGDESDMIASFWDEDVTAVKKIIEKPQRAIEQAESFSQPERKENEVENNDAINESMISSTFSDFDYRYQQINDFVLKPKKRNNKKQKRSQPASLVSISKRTTSEETSKKIASDEEASTSASNGNKTALLKQKPKKKNLASSGDVITSSVYFTKSLYPSTKVQSSKSTKSDCKSKKNNSASMLKSTVSPSPVCSSFGCTDSSDTPDMDESWFVTPPPCFTNVDKTKGTQGKLKQAHRENELIEHPSVYFSNETDNQLKLAIKKKSVVEDVLSDSIEVVSTDGNNEQKSRAIPKPTHKNQKASWKKYESKSPKDEASVSSGNKFIVTSWAFDEQDDIDDFDNMFEDECSLEESSKVSLKKKAKKKQNKFCADPIVSDSPVSMNESDESDLLLESSPVPVEIDEVVPEKSIEEKEQAIVEDEALTNAENIVGEVAAVSSRRRKTTSGEKKAPLPVQPIEPERKPGWQLKKKRNKRRSLSSSMPINQGTVKTIKDHYAYADSSSSSTSARSSPSIIDRIGSSIVANLTSLTSDFPGSSGLSMQSRAPMQEFDKLNNSSVLKKPSSELEMINRKKLSKGYMDRQNGCAKLGNSNRREGRGLKMHKTFNGYSVDRKVQTNFPKSQ